MKVREMRAWVVLGEWVLVKNDVVMDVVNADACLIEGVYVDECFVEEVSVEACLVVDECGKSWIDGVGAGVIDAVVRARR